MSRRRGQTPRDGRQNNAGQRGTGAQSGGDRRSRFLERLRVPSHTEVAAPAGMRMGPKARGSRSRKKRQISFTKILVVTVMILLGLAVGLSGFVSVLPQG